jgi:peptidoglycan hydrolase-like protein with peptidoglycan-binding domain
MSIQDQYNNAYAQCMFTRGNMVPGMGPNMMMQGAPQGALTPNMALTQPVQVQLIRLGYMPPPADGSLGPQTSNAISRFQGVAGMPVDGMPSSALLSTLQATR